jgi:CheY-like chemotaxis protein
VTEQRRDVVLVVDDEPDVLLLVELLLEADGFDVETAPTAEEALGRIERALPHLLLLDLRMPGLGGWGLLQHLATHGHLAALPVVVLSAHASDDAIDEAMALGCSGYVRKPFTGEELRSAVTAALGT